MIKYFGTSGGLAAKYRPQKLEDVVGQRPTVEALQPLLQRDKSKLPHCFFLSGPKGCGKTTLALIIANELDVEDINFSYLDSATYTGVDSIRDLRQKAQFSGMGGGVKFYLLDEVHRLSKNAQDALLILLENPPEHAYFALCTTEPLNVIETVRSRCVPYTLTTLGSPDMLQLINRVEEGEGISLPKKVKQEVVRAAGGSCRNCLMILDNIKDIEDEEKALKAINRTDTEEAQLNQIIQTIIKTKADNRWAKIRPKLKGLEGEPETIRRQVLSYLSKVLLDTDQNHQVADTMDIFKESLFYTGKPGLVHQFYLACQIE